MTIRQICCGMALVMILLSACRPVIIVPPPEVEPPVEELPEATPPPQRPEAIQDELRRREQVAAALTDQGRKQMDAGQEDAAIRSFEQALSQSPHYGPGYYYLAEAWLRKNSITQARAFHDQAVLYLHGEPAWQRLLDRQKKHIEGLPSELSIP